MESNPVRAVRPPAPYLGGKRNLASRLTAIIAAIPHNTYVEPFVGMGGVFLRRTSRPRAEVINDLSGDVANLFRILQRHYPQFMDVLRWQITSRAEFARLVSIDGSKLTDLERAARFLYLQRLAFGGKIQGRTFGVDRRTPARFDVTKLEPLLAEVHERLAGDCNAAHIHGEVARQQVRGNRQIMRAVGRGLEPALGLWCNRCSPRFASDIRSQRVSWKCGFPNHGGAD